MTKQEAMFRLALQEACIPIMSGTFKIDHPKARCYVNSQQYGVIFPQSFVCQVLLLSNEKRYKYNFLGVYTSRREWIREFISPCSAIGFTTAGREKPKDYFDARYYNILCKSKFTLCPVGDFTWTYRFLEAALCGSIPVIEKFDPETMPAFSHYLVSDKHEYREDWIKRNRELFLKECSL